MLGVLGSAGAAICLAPSRFTEEWNAGQPINAVTGTRLWAFVFSLPGTIDFGFAVCFYAAAATVGGVPLCNGWYTSPLTHR
jgi:hypothetical protein